MNASMAFQSYTGVAARFVKGWAAEDDRERDADYSQELKFPGLPHFLTCAEGDGCAFATAGGERGSGGEQKGISGTRACSVGERRHPLVKLQIVHQDPPAHRILIYENDDEKLGPALLQEGQALF